MLFVVGMLLPSVAQAVEIPPLAQRASWFSEARFGLFIHWGVYSVVGKGEWLRETGKIPLAEYNQLHPQFNPARFSAADWVGQAKRAGQKYLVITTKHHDGFCMFDSKLTDYDIMNTPLKRDVIKELADECHRQGLRLGFYYSIMDWHHPDYTPRRKWEKDRSSEGAVFDRYVDYMRGQLRELMTNYGRVDVLWFDGGWERKAPEDLKKFQDMIDMARQLQPQMLVNNRAFIAGDYETPEQFVPATGVVDAQGRPTIWEACITMTTGHGAFAPTAWWGYDRYEKVFKPTDELLQKLVDIASKGGNLLLNIGPTPEGVIRPEESQRMAAIGRWMAQYGQTIYGTSASPFRLLPFFGRVTCKGNMLFVHVFDWPVDGRLVLPGLKTQVVGAKLLGPAPAPVEVKREGGDVVLHLSGRAPDPIDSVVALELAGPAEVEPVRIAADATGAIQLPAHYAEINAQHGQRAKPMSKAGRAYIGNWSNPADIVVWHFELARAGKYRLAVDGRPASEEGVGQKVRISAGSKRVMGKITRTGMEFFDPIDLPAGKNTLSVELTQAKRTGPSVFDLYGVRLVPAK
jgi:alpha-L-fucosidase